MKVLRWITNCCDCTNVNTLFPEASLLPIETSVFKYRLQFAKRVCTVSPQRNPVTARLSYDFPLPDTFRTKSSFRHLLVGDPNLPRNWNQDPKPGRSFHPVDQSAFFFQKDFSLPLSRRRLWRTTFHYHSSSNQ